MTDRPEPRGDGDRIDVGGEPAEPVTLIPVAALGEPDLFVEVDAVAVLP